MNQYRGRSGRPLGPPLSRRELLRLLGGSVAAGVVPFGVSGCDGGAPGPAPGTGAPAPAPGSGAPAGMRFPDGFGWGAATSAYQVEGAAREDGRGESIWDRFSHASGNVANGDTGDVAADHYHRWEADLDLMKELGLGSYRFSIAWPRIQPTGRGRANQRGLDFYRRLLDGLHDRGIKPVVTLFHWDLPQRLQDAGGWENRDSAGWFADYADIVFRALGDRVPVWLTINEPKTIVNVGYTFGVHAPGKRDPEAAAVVAHHLLLAHGRAVQALRAVGGDARIGPALNLAPVYPASDADRGSPELTYADVLENRLYLDGVLKGRYPDEALDADAHPVAAKLRGAVRDGDMKVVGSPVDILGVQYYNPVFVDSTGRYVTKLATSAADWQQIFPQGLYDILTRVRRDYGDIPITITENGIAVDDTLEGGRVADRQRIDFVRDHLAAAHRAVTDGVRLESYHLWSLLDNFEWAEGYGQRWGIVHVDFDTQKRTWKDSALWYRETIRRNGF
jgi:beta-glucosidase